MIRYLRFTGALLACAATLTVAGAGVGVAAASTRSRSALVVRHQATARPASTAGFLLHAGLAFFVFDHYIYQPFKAGDLTHGLSHKLKIAEAVVAAVFVYHEMSLAITDVKSSKLAFLATPITALESKLSSLKSQLSGGNTSAVTALNSGLGSIGQQAAAKGFTVKPITSAP